MNEAIEKAKAALDAHMDENPYDPDAPNLLAIVDAAKSGRLIGLDGKEVPRGMNHQSKWHREIQNLAVASRSTRKAIDGIASAFK